MNVKVYAEEAQETYTITAVAQAQDGKKAELKITFERNTNEDETTIQAFWKNDFDFDRLYSPEKLVEKLNNLKALEQKYKIRVPTSSGRNGVFVISENFSDVKDWIFITHLLTCKTDQTETKANNNVKTMIKAGKLTTWIQEIFPKIAEILFEDVTIAA